MGVELSVVIPTFNRKDLLQEVLEALFQQTCAKDSYEIIVVSDGSRDDTAEMVSRLNAPVQLRFIEQPNQGGAAALNSGFREASGNIILCLDDDVIASPQLLEEHLQSHRAGGECVVLGKLCIHSRLGRNLLITFFAQSYEGEYQRMERAPASLRPSDLYSGNVSIPKEILLDMGGFDEELGRLADYDGELGYRLSEKGIRFVFNPKAVGYLAFLKDFEQRCRRAYDQGRSAVRQHQKHPESVWELALGNYRKAPIWRRLLRAYLLHYRPDSTMITFLHNFIKGLEHTWIKPIIYPCYRLIFDYYFWSGVQAEARSQGGLRRYIPKRIPVLAYHLVCTDPPQAMKKWSITPKTFNRQMAYLYKKGYQSITLDQLRRYLTQGIPLPSKPICITFDDGYQNNLTQAFPILAQYGFSSTVFLVADFMGSVNGWDRTNPRPALLSWEEAIENQSPNISFQSHSLSHKKLTSITLEEAKKEVWRSAEIISGKMGKPVFFFAYPYGIFNETIRNLAAAKGYKAAFSVDPGFCQPKDDLYRLKRIEIFYSDSKFDFFLKLKTGYNWRGWLRRAYRYLKRIALIS